MGPTYLPPELQAEQQGIERRKMLAQALLQQGMAPTQGQMAGRYYVPPSPLQGVAKLFQTYAGVKGSEQADQQTADLAKRGGEARIAALQSLGSNPDPMQLLGSQDPMLQQLGTQLFMQRNKPAEPYTLSPGAIRFGPDGKPIASAPFKPSEGFTLSPGAKRFDAEGKEIASAPEAPDELTRALVAAGIDPQSDEGRRLAAERLKKITTHPPAASMRVDVKTGEGLAKEIGPMVAESRAAALGSLQAAETAGRVRQAISSGNVTLGPTATVRNQINQIAQVMGIAGETTEQKLVNTREVARGLAQFTIAARKSLKGQGQVSDFEGKLLQKAESGQIDDFTVPELKAFIDVTERLAKLQYDLHSRNVDVMRQRPDLQNIVPFYEVPAWPESKPAKSGSGLSPDEQKELEQLRQRFRR